MPTASAVVADLIDTAVGRAQITFHALDLGSHRGKALRFAITIERRGVFLPI